MKTVECHCFAMHLNSCCNKSAMWKMILIVDLTAICLFSMQFEFKADLQNRYHMSSGHVGYKIRVFYFTEIWVRQYHTDQRVK